MLSSLLTGFQMGFLEVDKEDSTITNSVTKDRLSGCALRQDIWSGMDYLDVSLP